MKTYTNDRPLRTTTRAWATAEAIRDRVPFNTSGSLMGRTTTPRPGSLGGPWGYGHLAGLDLAWARSDDAAGVVDYVVWSYSTPIAWHMTDGTWHRVGQSFSTTTAKHQGNLYLIERESHETYLSPIRQYPGEPGADRWRAECDTCGSVVSCHVYKKDARDAAHTHRIAGRHGIAPPVTHPTKENR